MFFSLIIFSTIYLLLFYRIVFREHNTFAHALSFELSQVQTIPASTRHNLRIAWMIQPVYYILDRYRFSYKRLILAHLLLMGKGNRLAINHDTSVSSIRGNTINGVNRGQVSEVFLNVAILRANFLLHSDLEGFFVEVHTVITR